MFSIDFPEYQFDLKTLSGKRSIFDIIRKKYVAVTPEEFVRQHIIHYLVEEKSYPRSLLAVEMPLTFNTMKRRCDIVAFKNSVPRLIVECKAPSIKLDESVFEQIARYNLALKVPYLLVSNGHLNYCCKVNFDRSNYEFINNLPSYREL